MNRRIVIFGFTLLAVLALLATAVVADNPHQIYVRASGGDVCFKFAGLGDQEAYTVDAGATVTAEYWCMNNGGHHPKDPKKEQFTAPESQSGVFPASHNGQVTGCLTMPVPPPEPFCPPGQNEVLHSVTLSEPIWATINVP